MYSFKTFILLLLLFPMILFQDTPYIPTVTAHVVAIDGYRFEGQSKKLRDFDLTIKLFPSYSALRAESTNKPPDGKVVMAFTYVDEGSCLINIVDPYTDYRPEYLGHEVYHCLYGYWHPSQD